MLPFRLSFSHNKTFLTAPRLLSTLAVSTLASLALLTSAQAQTLAVGEPYDYSGYSSFGQATISGAGTDVNKSSDYVYTYGDGAGDATSDYKSVSVVGDLTLHSGGSITTLSLDEISNFTMDGGTVSHFNSIASYYEGITDSNFLSISGGTIGDMNLALYGYGGDTVDISGGSIQSLTNHAGILSISGGSLDNLFVDFGNEGYSHAYYTAFYAGGTAYISGGNVGPLTARGTVQYFPEDYPGPTDPISVFTTVYISGGTVGPLTAINHGGFDLSGTDLKLTGDGRITGFLADGQAIDTTFINQDGKGFLQFNGVAAVPEASTLLSFGLLLALGLGTVMLRRKGRQVGVSGLKPVTL